MPPRTPRPRGSRSPHRRELILNAAAELFVTPGYAKLSMADLAEAVGIVPSALYRHFSGKQQILATVLAAGLAPIHELVGALDPADPADSARRLSALALDQRHLGLMWQREARNLDSAAYQSLRTVVQEIEQRLSRYVHALRPELPDAGSDLLAGSIIAVMTSPSFHRYTLPRAAFEQLLATLVDAVLSTELPSPRAGAPRPPDGGPALTPASRREELLAQAIRMFAARGYAEVGIEEIARAAGIAGPSIYNHWPTKRDLLVTALRRGAAALAMDVAINYRWASDPADALRRHLRSHVKLAQSYPEIFSLLITDLDHLNEDEMQEIVRAQHEHVLEWAHLLRLHQPGIDTVAARIRVHAVLSISSETARTPHLRHGAAQPEAIEAIGANLLGLPGPESPPAAPGRPIT
ncbi:TetR/AcrR family transcriptional regulator [Amycolatopsis ultiminotia]|uniref:TetR/AcrR family transcriptional regulator n=1 Tax=Amycolatopsis ultiminotia TaxID=543629 RepID=A0ABP6WK77_9PSEU